MTSFRHEISGSFICYYTIDLKFRLEVKSETKKQINYSKIIRIGKLHFHFLALKPDVL